MAAGAGRRGVVNSLTSQVLKTIMSDSVWDSSMAGEDATSGVKIDGFKFLHGRCSAPVFGLLSGIAAVNDQRWSVGRIIKAVAVSSIKRMVEEVEAEAKVRDVLVALEIVDSATQDDKTLERVYLIEKDLLADLLSSNIIWTVTQVDGFFSKEVSLIRRWMTIVKSLRTIMINNMQLGNEKCFAKQKNLQIDLMLDGCVSFFADVATAVRYDQLKIELDNIGPEVISSEMASVNDLMHKFILATRCDSAAEYTQEADNNSNIVPGCPGKNNFKTLPELKNMAEPPPKNERSSQVNKNPFPQLNVTPLKRPRNPPIDIKDNIMETITLLDKSLKGDAKVVVYFANTEPSAEILSNFRIILVSRDIAAAVAEATIGCAKIVNINLLLSHIPCHGISRVHAILRPKQGSLEMLDMNSTNGTFINDIRMFPSRPEDLNDGDEVVFSGGNQAKHGHHIRFKTSLRYRISMEKTTT